MSLKWKTYPIKHEVQWIKGLITLRETKKRNFLGDTTKQIADLVELFDMEQGYDRSARSELDTWAFLEEKALDDYYFCITTQNDQGLRIQPNPLVRFGSKTEIRFLDDSRVRYYYHCCY